MIHNLQKSEQAKVKKFTLACILFLLKIINCLQTQYYPGKIPRSLRALKIRSQAKI